MLSGEAKTTNQGRKAIDDQARPRDKGFFMWMPTPLSAAAVKQGQLTFGSLDQTVPRMVGFRLLVGWGLDAKYDGKPILDLPADEEWQRGRRMLLTLFADDMAEARDLATQTATNVADTVCRLMWTGYQTFGTSA